MVHDNTVHIIKQGFILQRELHYVLSTNFVNLFDFRDQNRRGINKDCVLVPTAKSCSTINISDAYFMLLCQRSSL